MESPQTSSQPTSPSQQSTSHPRSIKSFADFLKSPNKISITVLGLLFVIIIGLIIAIMIVQNAALPSKQPTEIGRDSILEESNKITDIDRRLNYFEKLYAVSKTDTDKNLVTITCLESIIYSPSEARAIECAEKFDFNKAIATKDDLLEYYLYLRSLYSKYNREEYDQINQESAYLFKEIIDKCLNSEQGCSEDL